MRQLRVASIFLLSATLAAHAQARLQSVNLIQPTGKGRIIVPVSQDRKWERIGLFQGGSPLLTLQDAASNLDITYTILSNSTGNSAKDCRDTVMLTNERSLATGPSQAEIKQEKKSEENNAAGQPIASGSFLVASTATSKVPRENLFGFVAGHGECAEVHITKDNYTSADDAAMQSVLQALSYDADYTPTPPDYFLMGTLLSQVGKSYSNAAIYYQRAVDTLPADAPAGARHVMINQLSVAYDLSNQAAKSVPVNEAAIKTDADYPLYYVNLARADAELNKPAEARTHLQQAWDHKANLPSGEHMPDPTQDPSLQKLKSNSDFWSYAQTLK